LGDLVADGTFTFADLRAEHVQVHEFAQAGVLPAELVGVFSRAEMRRAGYDDAALDRAGFA
jgi:hypothetical protein